MVQEKTGDSNTTTPVIKTENPPPPSLEQAVF